MNQAQQNDLQPYLVSNYGLNGFQVNHTLTLRSRTLEGGRKSPVALDLDWKEPAAA